jgi:hypothetical protein
VSGVTYKCRSAVSIGNVTSGGLRTYAVNMAIQAGDFLGIYFAAGHVDGYYDYYDGVMYRAGNHCVADDSNTYAAYSYGGHADWNISIYGTGTSPI